jgi:hypothetical protein
LTLVPVSSLVMSSSDSLGAFFAAAAPVGDASGSAVGEASTALAAGSTAEPPL